VTADGHVGWGEGRPSPGWAYETLETVTATIERHLAPAVAGLPVTDRHGLHERMDAAIGRGPSTGAPVAKAALDIAVHDACAAAAGLTLRGLLGGADQRDRVELSYTVTAASAAEAAEAVARAREEDGLRHFNFKVGVHGNSDVAVAAAIRDAAGPRAFVWADANQSLSLARARRLMVELYEAGVDVLEQPLRADVPDALAQLRGLSPLALAVDESSVSPADLLRIAAAGLVDYHVMKLTRSGGLWPSLQQAFIAQAAGLEILVSGLTDSAVVKHAVCQLAAALGARGPAGLNGSQFIDDTALFPDRADRERGGEVRLSAGPGLGIAPDEDVLADLAERCRADLGLAPAATVTA
jgi:L-alanine-DL-glutamate epimerase-like enolase superfamily enzyme